MGVKCPADAWYTVEPNKKSLKNIFRYSNIIAYHGWVNPS